MKVDQDFRRLILCTISWSEKAAMASRRAGFLAVAGRDWRGLRRLTGPMLLHRVYPVRPGTVLPVHAAAGGAGVDAAIDGTGGCTLMRTLFAKGPGLRI